VNLVDVIVVALIALSIVAGWHTGFFAMVAGALGTIAGLFLGAVLVPPLTHLFGAHGSIEVLVAFVVVILTMSVVGTAFHLLGAIAVNWLGRINLKWIDNAGGSAAALVGTLALAWLLGGLLSTVPSHMVASAVQDSALLRFLDDRLPTTPEVFARVQTLLLDTGMPLPFVGFEPRADSQPLPSSAVVASAAKVATASAFKVQNNSCQGGVTGSGFVVDRGVVMTNAHVVAGGRDLSIVDHGQARRAVPIYFDSDADIAILRVDGLSAPSLTLAAQDAGKGDGAAVLGYPHGGPLTDVAAAVLDRERAIGRDIYGSGLVPRDIYILRADVEAGDSGAPFVDASGTVVGMVFARSLAQSEVGYALTVSELHHALGKVTATSTAVATGSCVR
jgi:S1-C subfamily serine protease